MTRPNPSGDGRPPWRSAPPLPRTATPTGAAVVPPGKWAAIVRDLACRGLPTDDIGIVSARAVTWSDGALGCPKPGVAYTQARVAGFQAIVIVEGQSFDYRFGRSDVPRLCQRRRVVA